MSGSTSAANPSIAESAKDTGVVPRATSMRCDTYAATSSTERGRKVVGMRTVTAIAGKATAGPANAYRNSRDWLGWAHVVRQGEPGSVCVTAAAVGVVVPVLDAGAQVPPREQPLEL